MAPTHHPGQGRHRTRKGDKLHFQTCQGGRINCKSKDNVMILLGVRIIMYACLCFIHQPCEISINYICKLTMYTPIYCQITTHKNPVQLLVSLTNHSRYMKLPYGEQQICPGEALFSILWEHATLLQQPPQHPWLTSSHFKYPWSSTILKTQMETSRNKQLKSCN